MSEIQNEDGIEVPDELTSLKQRADLMGISYHPTIGLETLRKKVNAKIEGDVSEDPEPEVVTPAPATKVVEESPAAKRLRLRNEAAALIRIRLTCMNPNKKEWEGEIITAGNSAVGTFKKYIPFNAEEGWHVPTIIYKQLVQRECQIFVTRRDERGNKVREGKMIKEFAIEVLPPLTKEELDDLAQRQAMSKSIS
jgi:hypothetical protein